MIKQIIKLFHDFDSLSNNLIAIIDELLDRQKEKILECLNRD